ncbi:MAG TPA: TIGR03618 family F420-dependent PPOX class oxidoreductase [Acidimicrobiales bacterium]|nr:TIGR03618 family F420-dependent PPOX class oxidoreductase [Acidimicrobiales bacterium]
MASIDDVRRLVSLDHALATVTTLRRNGTLQSTVVNAGVTTHPGTGDDVVAFVVRGGTRKLAHLRDRPVVTLVWRAGWAWVTVEGTAELCGPDDPLKGVDDETRRLLLRQIYEAAGGEHEDYAEFDRVMLAERRAAVLVTPNRIYQNP